MKVLVVTSLYGGFPYSKVKTGTAFAYTKGVIMRKITAEKPPQL